MPFVPIGKIISVNVSPDPSLPEIFDDQLKINSSPYNRSGSSQLADKFTGVPFSILSPSNGEMMLTGPGGSLTPVTVIVTLSEQLNLPSEA